MTLRFLVVAEDRMGVTLARDLCDRVVAERGPDWCRGVWDDPILREEMRRWTGIDPADSWTSWWKAKELAPHTDALGLRGYELVAKRTARLAGRMSPAPEVVVFCKDTDKVHDLRKQMERGIAHASVASLRFVLAIPRPESEAWILSGFSPENNAEQSTLRELREQLGFDPTAEPHRLLSDVTDEPRDPKRLCARLLPDGTHSPRARRCWLDTDLALLQQRGANAGLSEYVADIEREFLPLLGAR